MTELAQKGLVADAVAKDPTIETAKRHILEALEFHKQKITTVKAADPEKELSYQEVIKEFQEMRGGALWNPYLGSGMGRGALVELADGSVKYDFISGIGVHFGHLHPKIVEANLSAATQNIAMQGNLQQNVHSFALTKLLLDESEFTHCFLSSSGAMAAENALKLCFHKQENRKRLLAFSRCFMGRTLALSQITDKPEFRTNLPPTLSVDYLPFYDYREPKKSTERTLQVLKEHLVRYPKQHAAICIELVQGEGGYYPAPREFFVAVMELAKEEGIKVFVDEIQSFGRGETLFVYQKLLLKEYIDVVAVGKLLHTCATLYTADLKPAPGLLSQTYTAATSSIASALVIVKSLVHEGYLGANGTNAQLRKHMVDHLERIAKKTGKLQGPYGYGLMVAFTPFAGNRERVITFCKELFKRGIICFICGNNPTRIRFLVPGGGTTFADIDSAMAILEEALT